MHLIRSQGAASQSKGGHTQEHFVPSLISLDPHSFPPKALSQALISWAAAAYFLPSVKITFSTSAAHSVTQDSRTSASPSQVHKGRDILSTTPQPTQTQGRSVLWTLHARTGSQWELSRDKTQTKWATEEPVLTCSYYVPVTALGFLDITSLILYHLLQTISILKNVKQGSERLHNNPKL